MGLNLSVLPGLIVFGCGVLSGIALSIHFIRKALQQFRPQMVFFILGLMLGSPLTLATFSFPGFLGGVAVLGGLEAARHVLERRQTEQQETIYTEF